MQIEGPPKRGVALGSPYVGNFKGPLVRFPTGIHGHVATVPPVIGVLFVVEHRHGFLIGSIYLRRGFVQHT